MEIAEVVEKAAPLFFTYKNLDDEDLVEALVKEDFPLLLARRIVVFMPMAFGRVMLKELKTNFSDEYEYFKTKSIFTDKQKRKLLDEPVYHKSLKLASGMDGKEATGQIFLAIAFRSAEVKVINQMELDGANPENLVLTSMTTMWDLYDDESEPKITNSINQEENKPKSWWEFWK